MFLRLPWVVGQAGVILTIVIILLAGFVVTLTALSMSAISTNGEIQAGGAYYMISRAIGPKIGGAIGLIFSIANGIAVALYIVGFCETFVDNLGSSGSLTGNELNDVRIYGLILLVICLIMVLIGVGWVIKLQLSLLALLVCSILSFLIGSFITSDNLDKGFLGWGGSTLSDNLWPDFQKFDGIDYKFFDVFAVFFPAVTGIMAGANISGDLRNPSENIPKGTLWAIGVSTIVYIIMAIVAGAVANREYLISDSLFMVTVSFFGPLVLAGIYAATFSSALASLVGGPRLLQAVSKDKIIPSLGYFAETNDKGDPVRAYFVTFFCCWFYYYW